MSEYVELNEAKCDYLTVSTFDPTVYKFYLDNMKILASEAKRSIHPESRQQYKIGDGVQVPGGYIWCGRGVQNERPHFLVQISGELAHSVIGAACKQQSAGAAKVKRLDLQVTTECPDSWSQPNLLMRMLRKGKLAEYRATKDGDARLDTVYIGSRTSERFNRIYIKKTAAGNRLIRFETEYKGMRAYKMAASMAENGIRAEKYLNWEVRRCKDKKLSELFLRWLGNEGISERVSIESTMASRRKWLLNSVLPALREYVNAHGSDRMVVKSFMDALVDRELRPDEVNDYIRILEERPLVD